MELKQLSKHDYEQNSIREFQLQTQDHYTLLHASDDKMLFFEWIFNTEEMVVRPYKLSEIEVSNEQPLAWISNTFQKEDLLQHADVTESAYLEIDHIFLDYAESEHNAQIIQADFAPGGIDGKPVFATLSDYGALLVFTKRRRRSSNWYVLQRVHEILQPEDYMRQLSNVDEVRNLLAHYQVSTFSWHIRENKPCIYLGTKSGHVVCVCFSENYVDMEMVFRAETQLDTIFYIKAFEQDKLLVCCSTGIVQLFKIQQQALILRQSLWSVDDDMPCQAALVQYCAQKQCHYVVYNKYAHIIAHCIFEDDTFSTAHLIVDGAKITSMAWFDENSFAVSTLAGSMRLIKLYSDNKSRLQLEEIVVKTPDFDLQHYQLCSFTLSRNKALWTFLLYRNQEYKYMCEYKPNTCFISICKINADTTSIVDELSKVCSADNMHPYVDLLLALRLSVYTVENLRNLQVQLEICEDLEISHQLLVQLQIKRHVALAHSRQQHLRSKFITDNVLQELDLLQNAILITHCLMRLQCLSQYSQNGDLSKFQLSAGNCLLTKVNVLLKQLHQHLHEDEGWILKPETAQFITIAQRFLNKITVPISAFWNEFCEICAEPVDANTFQCANAHQNQRCMISFKQLPLDNKHYCAECGYQALHSLLLAELYLKDEAIKCIYCGCALVTDEEDDETDEEL